MLTKEELPDVIRQFPPVDLELTDDKAREIAYNALKELAEITPRVTALSEKAFFIARSIHRQKQDIAATMQKVHN